MAERHGSGAVEAGAGRTAIICSAMHWSAPIHLSAHHLAKFLADRGWTVCFLSTPTSFLHRLRHAGEPDARDRFADWRRGGGWDPRRRIYHYTPLTVLPPSRMPGLDRRWLFRSWPRVSWPAVVPHLGARGFGRPDIMIVDSALMLPVWQGLGQPRLVYRVTDRNSEWPGRPPMLDELEVEIARAAELVVYTGDALAPYVARLGATRSLCIPNGVELSHFAAPRPPPPEFTRIPAPRAIYVGTIAEWLDTALLARAARALPAVSFVVIGPGSERLRPLAGFANVHLLGGRPYADVPAYLQHSAVGLIPFRRQELAGFVDDINPLKLYEYMATGLPVVATPFRQLLALGSPAVVTGDPDAFVAAIAERAARRGDGAAERSFAQRFDWPQQFMPLAMQLGL